MIKKLFFSMLLAFTILNLGCQVYDEIIDAAIVDQASKNSEDTTTTTSDDSLITTTASDTSSLVTTRSSSSLTFPP